MKKFKFALFAVLVFAMMLVGCTAKKEVAAQPIDEAVDTCAKCHMAVKNNGYSAQYITEDSKSVKFDDIGCMEKYSNEHTDVKIAGKFIQDVNSKEWLKYEEASYVFAMDTPTPMGYGIHAFKEKTTADQFAADKKGEVLTGEQIKTHEWKQDKSKMMMKMNNTSNQNQNMNMNNNNADDHAGHNH